MTNDLAHMGVEVTLNRVKIVNDNLTGDETRTYGEDITVKVFKYHETENKRLVESGYAREGAIIVYAKPEDRIKKNDRLIIDGAFYLVENDPLLKGFPNIVMYHQFTCLKSSRL